MAVQSISSAAAPVTAATASSASGAAVNQALGLNQNDFMKLLISQMQHQDPLNPVSSTDFITQVSQFANVSSMQTLNSNMTQMLAMQQMAQGPNLIGKQITYSVPGSNIPGSGVVSALQVNNGSVNLLVGNQSVAMSQILTIAAGKTN